MYGHAIQGTAARDGDWLLRRDERGEPVLILVGAGGSERKEVFLLSQEGAPAPEDPAVLVNVFWRLPDDFAHLSVHLASGFAALGEAIDGAVAVQDDRQFLRVGSFWVDLETGSTAPALEGPYLLFPVWEITVRANREPLFVRSPRL